MTQSTAVTRPLKVLVPMIKDELEAGDSAGIEHYRRAGQMLLEAKAQVAEGEWNGWLDRNFHLKREQARRYMKLADIPLPRARGMSSIREALGSDGGGSGGGKVSWHEPVKQIAAKVNVDRLNRERQDREREAQMLHTLGHQLINIGYKVLAAKLHPDKGGSTEAMARLNRVRSTLKEAI